MELVLNYILLPIVIFLARIVDVSLGTIRIIFISKGYKILSLLIGFFEVLIWLVAINQIWSDFTNIWLYLAYAGGFATGTFVGIWLDEKISLGSAMVRIIIKENPDKLIKELTKNNYRATILKGRSGYENSEVSVIFSVIKRKDLKNIFQIINKIDSDAFYTVEDIRSAKKNELLILEKKTGLGKKFK
jgi:uncharacterized protein YebE (UPF0316 family)